MGDAARYCLNTATIRGQRLGIVEQVALAGEAGYGAIEPWVSDLREYREAGGSLSDLRNRIADAGLAVPSAIGFARWLADQQARREAGLEQAKRDMELVAAVGGTGIAAPPAGMTKRRGLDPRVVGQRYRALLAVGEQAGVVPVLELWGFSQTLCRLGEVLMAAVESGHPDACVLLDVYHLYKGGNAFESLRLLGPNTCPVLHMNDYPAKPPRETIGDGDRCWPGDGVAPLGRILGDLYGVGFRGWLSLELFNKAYWRLPAKEAVTTGLKKMKAAVKSADIAG